MCNEGWRLIVSGGGVKRVVIVGSSGYLLKRGWSFVHVRSRMVSRTISTQRFFCALDGDGGLLCSSLSLSSSATVDNCVDMGIIPSSSSSTSIIIIFVISFMGVAGGTGKCDSIEVGLLGASISGVITPGLKGTTPVFLNANLMLSLVSAFAWAQP